MQTIVTGYDGSRCAGHALERASELARAFASKLVVVSVGAPVPLVAPELMISPTIPVAPAPGALAAARRERGSVATAGVEPEDAARLLDQARNVLAPGVDADFVAERGDPVDRLVAVADERDADLIVLGCHHHSFLQRHLGHAVEEELPRRTRRDVLLVHSPDD